MQGKLCGKKGAIEKKVKLKQGLPAKEI